MPKRNSDSHKRNIATYATKDRHAYQLKVSKDVTSSRDKVAAFLVKAGIITKKGKVSSPYRSTLKLK